MGGRVGEVKTNAEPATASLSTVAPSATAGGEKPRGKEGGASAAVGEEEKAREELGRLIEEHRPEGPAALAGTERHNAQPARSPQATDVQQSSSSYVQQQNSQRGGGVKKMSWQEILSVLREVLGDDGGS
jgi:hypothetical protein